MPVQTTNRFLQIALGGLLFLCVYRAPAPVPTDATAGAFEKECATLGRLIEQEVATRDAGLLKEFFDLDALVDRALAGFKYPPDMKTVLRNGFRVNFEGSFRPQLTGAANFHLLRVRVAEGQMRALFRLIPSDGGPNYLDMICARSADGAIRVADVDLLATGHKLSDMARRGFLLALAEAQDGVVEGASGAERELIQHRREVMQFNRLAARREGKAALAVYLQLPAALQKDKLLLSNRLNLAGQSNAADYEAAFALWRATYPKDPSTELMSFDGCVLKKRHEEALAALDRLEKHLGGDPYLDVLRAAQWFPLGQPGKARTLADKAQQRDPTLARVADSVLAPVWPPEMFRLQGIVFAKTPSAILDGKTVFIGDAVGRFRVKWIDPDAVTLESPSGLTRVLELKEVSAR